MIEQPHPSIIAEIDKLDYEQPATWPPPAFVTCAICGGALEPTYRGVWCPSCCNRVQNGYQGRYEPPVSRDNIDPRPTWLQRALCGLVWLLGGALGVAGVYLFIVIVLFGGVEMIDARNFTEEPGKVSDGYHTFDELYEHRVTLWIALCRLWNATRSDSIWRTAGCPKNYVWRSKKHSDGGAWPDWFVLGIMRAGGEQITYHVPLYRWNECEFALTLEYCPPFDGHTSVDVLDRLARIE